MERLTELEGKIKILRNKGSTLVFAEFSKTHNELNQRKNDQKQIKKRIENVESDSYSLK